MQVPVILAHRVWKGISEGSYLGLFTMDQVLFVTSRKVATMVNVAFVKIQVYHMFWIAYFYWELSVLLVP